MTNAEAKNGAVRILYSDGEVCVAVKEPGVLSEKDGGKGMPERIAAALGVKDTQVYPVHRLDRETGGVMVYALTPKSAAGLGKSVREGRLDKRYYAAVSGRLEEKEGEWRDLLYHDPVKNRSYTVKRMRRGVREAVLLYRAAKAFGAGEGYPAGEVLDIRLVTGRTHQIRVQCASRGHPLLGDKRYGSPCGGPLALWCWRLSFPHPGDGRMRTFECAPEGALWQAIDGGRVES